MKTAEDFDVPSAEEFEIGQTAQPEPTPVHSQPQPTEAASQEHAPEEPLPDNLKDTFKLLEQLSAAENNIGSTPPSERKALLKRLERVKQHFFKLQQGPPTIELFETILHQVASSRPEANIASAEQRLERLEKLRAAGLLK